MDLGRNPYHQPVSAAGGKRGKRVVISRISQGLLDGGLWGAAVGFVRGIVAIINETGSAYVILGSFVVVYMVVGALVCSVGRGISGRLAGAWLGFVAGLFLGFFLGDAALGDHWLHDVYVNEQSVTIVYTVGQLVGGIAGSALGTIFGALTDRLVRGLPAGRPRTSPPNP